MQGETLASHARKLCPGELSNPNHLADFYLMKNNTTFSTLTRLGHVGLALSGPPPCPSASGRMRQELASDTWLWRKHDGQVRVDDEKLRKNMLSGDKNSARLASADKLRLTWSSDAIWAISKQ